MCKTLEENFMLRLDNKLISTKVVLINHCGGKTVYWVDDNGNIIKSKAYSRTKYSKDVK